jgi:uncharacterized protein
MPVSNLSQILRTLDPLLHRQRVGFFLLAPDRSVPDDAIAVVRESEGTTVILPLDHTTASTMQSRFDAAWITLRVHSDLAAVGLTAAVSTALADVGISCNVIAAVHHDHLFVPASDADRAMNVLRALQSCADAV